MKAIKNIFFNFFLGLSLKILIKFLNKLVRSSGFILESHNNELHNIGKNTDKNSLRLVIKRKSLYFKLILCPGLYFGEAYVKGDVIISNGNLSDFLKIILSNVGKNDYIFCENIFIKTLYAFKNFLRKNNIMNSKNNVAHHYDISDNLYKLFLDSKMQYSCAYFKDSNESLEKAQLNKIKHIIKKLDINKNCSILDIGSGWGGLSIEIARETGAKVCGITLSENQLKYSKYKAKLEGLDHLITFKLSDYRDINDKYDRIVSVGMFEHVGKDYYNMFFNKINSLLLEDGFALIHTIGSLTPPKPVEPWINKYIFPGGYIPTISEISPIIEKSKLVLCDLEIWRTHYAKTLSKWKNNFLSHREEVITMFNEEFVRMWEYYLTSCQYSFVYNNSVVFQILLSKNLTSVPITRDYIYK